MRQLTAAIGVFLMAVSLSGARAWAAPDAELWPRWQNHDAHADIPIDHSPWDRFLRTYVSVGQDGIARVAYRSVETADRAALDAYIARLERIQISIFNRSEQFAYWVNLYNALTVRLVLDHYPVARILDIDISPGLLDDGPWSTALVRIEGEAVTLDDIEHRILRPIWRDPRIHYALNCAAIGCPNLAMRAFTAENTETMLEHAAFAYINHRRGAEVRGGKLYVSSVYDWFAEDFGGGSDAAIIAHLRRYAASALANALKTITEIEDDHYDWSLNDAARN